MEIRATTIRNRMVTIAALAVLMTTGHADATPRLAASYGQNCQLCHVNPTGGGMRTSFVTQFMGPTELALKPLTAHEPSLMPNPKINDQITIGADFRMLYLAEAVKEADTGHGGHQAVSSLKQPSTSPVRSAHLDRGGFLVQDHGNATNSFLTMQGSVYLSFDPDPHFTLYFAKGWYGGFETFALGRVLPAHGYIKVGQFVPDIGWRWDDHTRFTRLALWPSFPVVTDAGIEAGIYPGPFVASAGVFNGAANAFDDNSQKEIVGRVLYRQRIGSVHAALGGSARWNRGPDSRELTLGAQGQAGWGRLAYLGDFFRIRRELLGPDTPGTTRSWVFSQQLDFKPHRGVDLYLGYDFYDPNTDSGGSTQSEVSVGSRIYIRHFLKIEPVLRLERIGEDTSRRLELIVHAFY